jgi:integrase
VNPNSDTLPDTRKREGHLSTDGKWRSFPKVPHLLQYVNNGNYYGRIKVGGKLIRESLQTDVWSTAKIRLTDFLKKNHERRIHVDTPKFSDVAEAFKQDTEQDARLKPKSKEYRLRCLAKIQETWPELWNLRVSEIASSACKEWAANLNGKIASHYYNNTLATLRLVIDAGIKQHKQNGGATFENPAAELKRVKVKQKDLKLPEPSQFKDLVANIRQKSGGWGPRVADLVEFLAYGGMRIYSEALQVNWEDVDWKRKEIVVRGNSVTSTKNGEIRRVPMLPDMECCWTTGKNSGNCMAGKSMFAILAPPQLSLRGG